MLGRSAAGAGGGHSPGLGGSTARHQHLLDDGGEGDLLRRTVGRGEEEGGARCGPEGKYE